ncbi:hypothetical protein [Rhodococcus wratislaviensis]|nr:hypothetical protein [Rhodococcus wratislaviensis]
MAGLGAPSGYWLIRRLDVDAAVGGDWTSSQMAGGVASAMARSLDEALRSSTSPESMLWFPDRASFLGRFLLDLAEGRASRRWEYGQFAELMADPHAALGRLAATEPEVVLEALLHLDIPALATVIDDVEPRLVSEVLRSLTGSSGEPLLGAVLEATRDLTSTGRLPDGERAALMIAFTAARRYGAAPFGAYAVPAAEVAAALRLLHQAQDGSHEVATLLSIGAWTELMGVVGSTGMDSLLPLVGWSADDRRRLCTIVTEPESDRIESDRILTPYGGMFLLLPLLDDLWDWESATRDWPDVDGVPSNWLAQLLVLTAALGRGRTTATVGDPVLRLALDIPDGLETRALASWLGDLGPEQLESFAERVGNRLGEHVDECASLTLPFASSPGATLVGRAATSMIGELGRRLPGMAAATTSYLGRNVLEFDAAVTVGAEQVVAELGSPPLHVLLSLAGLNRGTFRPPGDGNRTWMLTTRA